MSSESQAAAGAGAKSREGRHGAGWVVVALLVLGMGGVMYAGVEEAKGLRPLHADTVAPPFKMERLTGGTVSSEELHGKVVMLDFWATWCPPCRAEMPMLVRLAREYEGKGVVFLAANRDEPTDAEGAVTRFAAGPGLQDLKRYAAFADDPTSDAYNIRVLPTLFVVGKDGKFQSSETGMTTEAKLRHELDAALAK